MGVPGLSCPLYSELARRPSPLINSCKWSSQIGWQMIIYMTSFVVVFGLARNKAGMRIQAYLITGEIRIKKRKHVLCEWNLLKSSNRHICIIKYLNQVPSLSAFLDNKGTMALPEGEVFRKHVQGYTRQSESKPTKRYKKTLKLIDSLEWVTLPMGVLGF